MTLCGQHHSNTTATISGYNSEHSSRRPQFRAGRAVEDAIKERAVKSLSLYVHIPFCSHRCSYCDFNTYTTLGHLQSAYAGGIVSEVRQVAGSMRRKAHTLFFGGGTPSLMSVADMQLMLNAVAVCFELQADSEISMEANPNSVDGDYLSALRALGINRISFGLQSVVPSELQLLERQHDFNTAVRAVQLARRAGFDNINIDLIYGLPGQTLASWRQSVEAVLALDPQHLSLYCLTIEPGTPMQRWLHNGKIMLPDPDLAADQFELAGELLAASGYDHYEISNWAKPGFQCAHNLTYWRNGDYLGLGAGAHGHADNIRYHVVRQPRVYLRRIEAGDAPGYPLSSAVAGWQRLDADEQIADVVITQLRLLHEGIDIGEFERRFGRTPHEQFGNELDTLLSWNLLRQEEGRLLLSDRGRFLSNQVFSRLI